MRKYRGLPNAIGSAEFWAGPSPSNSPDGPQTDLFGQEAAHASPSAPQAKEKPKRTPVTYGRRGFASSASAALSASLGSRLQERLDGAGSMEYAQTWKRKVTPSGRQYWEHIASARRTSGSVSTGWPTPMASKLTPQTREDFTPNLAAVAQLAGWPTATARDWKDGRSNQHGKNSRPLNEVAMLAGWATPAAQPANSTPEAFLERKRAAIAKGSKMGVVLSDLNMQAQAYLRGLTPSPSSAPTGAPGAYRLNPRFSLWLQGYPATWYDCGGQAMPSSPRQRRSS